LLFHPSFQKAHALGAPGRDRCWEVTPLGFVMRVVSGKWVELHQERGREREREKEKEQNLEFKIIDYLNII
jgi:hypothetical protein